MTMRLGTALLFLPISLSCLVCSWERKLYSMNGAFRMNFETVSNSP